jgi:hypothetical protein
LYDIDKKTFLTEPTTNFSSELAFWVGMAAAFLFHALFKSFINISATFDLLLSDTVCSILWFILFFAVVNIVAASYVFPVTKESSLFLDLGNANFVIPLLRNLVITSVTAAVISYGLSVDLGYVSLVLSAVFGGFLFLFLGFTGARRTESRGRISSSGPSFVDCSFLVSFEGCLFSFGDFVRRPLFCSLFAEYSCAGVGDYFDFDGEGEIAHDERRETCDGIQEKGISTHG